MRTTLASFLLSAILLSSLSACKHQDQTQTEPESDQPRAITVALKENGLAIGEKAPDFKLEHIDGSFYSLAEVKDANGQKPKGYIVVFTCNTCPVAQQYESRLIELHHRMAPLGYPVVAIQPNDPGIQSGESMKAMQARAKEKAYPFLYLMDAGQKIYPQYGATRTPEVFLLDSNNILRYHGAVDDNVQAPEEVSINYVENAVRAMENGESPEPAEVRAIGCGIKAKRI